MTKVLVLDKQMIAVPAPHDNRAFPHSFASLDTVQKPNLQGRVKMARISHLSASKGESSTASAQPSSLTFGELTLEHEFPVAHAHTVTTFGDALMPKLGTVIDSHHKTIHHPKITETTKDSIARRTPLDCKTGAVFSSKDFELVLPMPADDEKKHPDKDLRQTVETLDGTPADENSSPGQSKRSFPQAVERSASRHHHAQDRTQDQASYIVSAAGCEDSMVKVHARARPEKQ